MRRRARPRVCPSKVFVHLFQKVADSKGSAFGRHPQMAERSILQAYLGVWGPLQEKGPQGPSQFHFTQAANGLPDGEVAPQGPEGALALCLPAAAGGLVTEKFLSFGIFRLPPVVLGGVPLLKFSGILPEGLSGPAPTGGSLSCAGKKVTKETAGGLCRPPGPQALSFETCSRSWPSG